MAPESPLRHRIVGVYLLVTLALGTSFGIIGFLTLGSIEDRLVNHRLEIAADILIDDHLRGLQHRLPGYPIVVHGEALTPLMRSLSSGVHEIDVDDRVLHMLVRDRGPERFVVVDDESQFDRIERYAAVAFALSFVLCVMVATALGVATAGRVIAPVIALAKAVQERSLGADSPQLRVRDELGVLARAFVQHSEQLQQFLLREQLFTGDVSHELRTPLTVILGAAEVLHSRLAGQPELQEVAQRIRRTAADTAERVTALLLLSRSPDEMDAPTVDLVALMEQEAERCRPLLNRKAVALRVVAEQPAVWVHARPELAAIAIGNLLRNACQFTESGEVRLTAMADRILIEDTGCGIPAEVQSRIFERHVHAGPPGAPGTGLGLAIVRRVAQHLGWRVELESSTGAGSRFAIHLPQRYGIDGADDDFEQS